MPRAFVAAAALFAASLAHAQGITDTQILLGQSVALSGPAAELGKDMQSGALLYFNNVNRSGGVNGRKIVLTTLDDGYEPPRAVENTKKLINDEKVFALFGYVGTPTSNASLPIFTEAKVPFVGAFTGAESLRAPFNRAIFNVRASYFDETEAIVQHLTAMSVTSIAVFYQNDAYGQAGLTGVERAMKRRNMEITSRATVERNTVDVAKAVAEMKKANPQAIIMISAYKSCAAFIKDMKKAGVNPTFWNVSFVGSKALAKELAEDGRGVQISQVVPFPWDTSIPVVKEYRALLEEAKGEPGFGTLEGFIAAKVMVEGLKRAGRGLTRESFTKAMESMNAVDVGGFKVSFGPDNHNASKFVDLTIISRDQKFVR
ncbi:Leucine-, isoleucine-, valine-, threonine-, and alanine-binding protein [Usitatibacter rugosus]|uniref:Leucine-, isoleucine-, valine-, threonine-, and alanine-binding protein n=1 Tax=Usitatibacter rugosus TaxID=2732067 RepID=A0A6M4GVM9_9PROT|nr:ABC transporter substrate-binding protein [Usitatibacter rugosus]QJR10534.1 Leucine-, isoleucine-, valine-, threonine-, and alanine-binding protein [Usitatibacter rugosus]